MLRALALLLLFAPAFAAGASWSSAVEGEARWDSNVSNATLGGDAIGALALSTSLAARSRVSLAANDALIPEWRFAVEAWPSHSELTTLLPGATLEWQHKAGLGAGAPVFFVSGRLEGLLSRDQNRRGFAATAGGGVRRRIGDTTRLEATQEFSRVEAHAVVYDRDSAQTTVSIRQSFEIAEAGFSVFWRYGDVVSHATPPRPDLVTEARHRLTVDTFGRGFVAYSLRAPTLGGRLSLRRPLNESSSVAAAYEYRHTERGALRYVNHLVSLSASHSF